MANGGGNLIDHGEVFPSDREDHAALCSLAGQKELPESEYYMEKQTGKVYLARDYYGTSLTPREMVAVEVKIKK